MDCYEQKLKTNVPVGTVEQDIERKGFMDISFSKEQEENVPDTQTLPQMSIPVAPNLDSVSPVAFSVSTVHPPVKIGAQIIEKVSDAGPNRHTETQLQKATSEMSLSPHFATGIRQPVTLSTPEENAKHEEDLSESSSHYVTRYTITSPSWLPSGWITEIQIRKTGTSAGLRDKYYKDLLTGRRFRSRNEVLHFLETGKGRARRRDRDKKALPTAPPVTVVPPMNALACRTDDRLHPQGPSACCQPWQPVGFLVSPYLSKQAASVGFYELVEPQTLPMTMEIDNVFKCPNDASARTSNQPPSNMITSECHQMLVVKKEVNISMSQIEDDNQSSGILHLDQKPVEESYKSAQNKNLDSGNAKLNTPSLDEQLPEVGYHSAPVSEYLKGTEAAQMTVQLGKEIQASQKLAVQLSKELQETVHKLVIEIQAAGRNLHLRSNSMSCNTNIQAAQKAIDSVLQAAETIYGVMGNIVQAQDRVDNGMQSIIQASEWLDAALCSFIKPSQLGHEETTMMAQSEMFNNCDDT